MSYIFLLYLKLHFNPVINCHEGVSGFPWSLWEHDGIVPQLSHNFFIQHLPDYLTPIILLLDST
jgi:hypothetical protein